MSEQTIGSRPTLFLCAVFLVVLSTLGVAQSAAPGWSQWRGPNRDGTVTTPLPSNWPVALTKRWELSVGAGQSSPVIAGNRVVQHSRQGANEITRAIALDTGQELWRDEYAAPYNAHPATRRHGPGPRSTPAVARGRVFTFGISGILSALELETGKLLWRKEAPAVGPEFGTAMSPLADGDNVIAHVGGMNGGALTAFDAATGAIRWQWSGDTPAYASPVIATIGGTRHVITQTRKSVVSVNATDGTLLWQLPFTTFADQSSVTPVVSGDLVIYSGIDAGITAVRITRTGTEWPATRVWKNDDVPMYMSSPVINGTTLYGHSHKSSGRFFAVDVATGKTLWTTAGRDAENASFMTAGSVLLVSTTNSELIVLRAHLEKFEELRRYTVADSAMWAHPAFAQGVMLVKDVDKLVCWATF